MSAELRSEPAPKMPTERELQPVQPFSALVVGASGGLGAAWLEHLRAQQGCAAVFASRRPGASQPANDDRMQGQPDRPETATGRTPQRRESSDTAGAAVHAPVHPVSLDLEDPASIESVAQTVRETIAQQGLPPLRTVIVASGLLHAPGLAPEKSLRALDAAALQRLMAVNAIGPALLARQVLPLMPRQGRVVFAAVSARVGSISDNRLGGWYGYRASKAALNQFIRTLAIEWSRTAKDSVCVGLHPGTVDTGLSRPFQGNVPEGKLFTPEQSVGHLEAVLQQLAPQHSGRCFAWDGQEVMP